MDDGVTGLEGRVKSEMQIGVEKSWGKKATNHSSSIIITIVIITIIIIIIIITTTTTILQFLRPAPHLPQQHSLSRRTTTYTT